MRCILKDIEGVFIKNLKKIKKMNALEISEIRNCITEFDFLLSKIMNLKACENVYRIAYEDSANDIQKYISDKK